MALFQGKNLVGIDIGDYSVKLVLLGGRKGSYALKSAACMRVPKEGPVSGEVSSPALLHAFIRSQRLQGRRAAAVVSGQSLVFRHLQLPVMPEKDLKEAVRWEIRKEVAIPHNELVSDYVVTGTRTVDNNLSIIAFAAMRSEIERTMELYKAAGLDLRAVDAAPTALLASFDMNNDWEDGVNYAMLDIGEVRSTLAVFKNRNLAFAREITIGGADVTKRAAETLGKTEEEAREYKVSFGLSQPEGASADGRGAVGSVLGRLASEVQRSFNYYQAQFREGSIAKLFLSGGTARLKGIEGFMTENTGIPSFTDDPLRKVKVPSSIESGELRAIAPCLTIAAGLATRTE